LIICPLQQHAVQVPAVIEAWVQGLKVPCEPVVDDVGADDPVLSQHVTVWVPFCPVAAPPAVFDGQPATTFVFPTLPPIGFPQAHPQLAGAVHGFVPLQVERPQQPPFVSGCDPGAPVQFPDVLSGHVRLPQPLVDAPTLQAEDRLLEAWQQQQQPLIAPAPWLLPQESVENSSHAKFVGEAAAAGEGTASE
jgi:hypothetical protein